jgi:hypothetical protein
MATAIVAPATAAEQARTMHQAYVQHIRRCDACIGTLCRTGRDLEIDADAAGWRAANPPQTATEAPAGASTITAPTPSQWASAATHLERRADWRTIRIDGTRYVVLPSGNSGRTYILRADAAGCQCPWYARTGTRCSHMLAVELDVLERELASVPAALARRAA